MLQSDTIKALTALVEKQAVQITALLIRVENLEQELSFYKNRKNNGNSHIPFQWIRESPNAIKA
ncbi:hypothetical protein ADIARSV_3260 [Arcticibacter svalbardensis MN12-7]|uniref:Transposase n=1 Tax=Arcticibacter svalbardensis MN12-7 TaxID=1150600 RepID=R9GNY4_9SPHI|nr:hypothetical protein [Arcticibacter svalbardensis]EOR93547.1 hypothetical protein ADIARSV_3260 [Arcticibacter svalbardensis MN12-7]